MVSPTTPVCVPKAVLQGCGGVCFFLLFFFQCSDPGFYVSYFLAVLPGLAERPQLMTLWSECSGSAGLFHTTLDRVFQHMRQHYTAVLQERHPHSADEGYIIVFHFSTNKAEVTSNKSSSCFSSTVFIPCWFSCCYSEGPSLVCKSIFQIIP